MKAYHIRKNKGAERLLRPKVSSYETIPADFLRLMSNIQAKQGLQALTRIHSRKQKIEQNARALREALAGLPGVHVFRASQALFNEMLYFSVLCERKEDIKRYLFSRRIEVEEESASDLTRDERFKVFVKNGSYPNASALAGSMIFLPSHPGVGQKDLAYIIERVREAAHAPSIP